MGSSKELSLPPSAVGKIRRVTKPDKRNAEVAIVGEKGRAVATVDENSQAGIYRVALPAGAERDGVPQLYAVNSPFLESRLDEISPAELQAKLKPN